MFSIFLNFFNFDRCAKYWIEMKMYLPVQMPFPAYVLLGEQLWNYLVVDLKYN